ncbi:hypothetical protein ACLKA7_002854 [Drosophila subpalustris]
MSGSDDGNKLIPWQPKLEHQETVRSMERELLEEAIVITHYVSPTKFRYVMLQELRQNGRIVNHIEAQLPAHCHAANHGTSYQRFQHVILRYLPMRSEKYMRGQVISFNGDNYLVEALDYGFLIQCHGKDLWQLPKELRNRHIEIKDGGLAGVSSLSGNKWSKSGVCFLQQKLKEAALLIFRIGYHNYGQLLIKSSAEDEPLLNAAHYLVESQRARPDPKYMTQRNDEPPFNMENMELNGADVKPSACVAAIIGLVGLQQVKLPLSEPNPKEEKPKQKTASRLPRWFIHLCKEPTTRTIPESARRLSLVKNSEEASVETALMSGSSSISSSASNCSSDSFDFSIDKNRKSKKEPMIVSKINQRLTVHSKESLQQQMSKIEEQPQDTKLVQVKLDGLLTNMRSLFFNPESQATTSESFLNCPKEPLLEKPMPSTLNEEKLDRIINEMRNTAYPVEKVINHSQQLKPKAVVGTWDQEKLDRIIREMRDMDNPLKKVARQSSQLKTPKDKFSSKAVVESQDQEKLDRIIREMSDLDYPVTGQEKQVLKQSALNPVEKVTNQSLQLASKETETSKAKSRTKMKHNEQLILAHSKGQVLALNGTAEALFRQDVWVAMGAMKCQWPSSMQRYAWPHLMRGNSMVLIDGVGRGRSWCYLPMLCSLVTTWMRRPPARNKDALKLGPLAVLLADSVGNARMLFNHCSHLMRSDDAQMLNVVNTHDHSLLDVQLMLLSSCGILITTVSHMKRLFIDNKLNLTDPHRLKYFIVDDYDRMLSAVPDLLNESLQLLQSLAHPQLQLILIAQQWHGRVFHQLIKRFGHNPLLLFGDFLVAAIYGNLKIDLDLRHSSKKKKQLIDYLASLAKTSFRRRTVVYCKSREELENLQEALTAAGHDCIGLGDAVHQQIHELLLVTDELQSPTELPIRNFELLVHYSLPSAWTKFSYRFHAIIDSIGNCLVPHDKKQKDILSYVMLDEKGSHELLRLAQFLKAHDIKLDKHIDQMVASCRRETDRNRVLCPQMLSKGECSQKLCHKRHFAIDEDFQRSNCEMWQPETVVRCKLIKIHNPVHFAALAESFKSIDCESWQPTLTLSKLKELSTALSRHMTLAENRRVQQKLKISYICVIFRDMRYQRVRVVDLSDQRLVGVQLLDEGTELLKVKITDLLECDVRFKELPPLAMDVRLCGLKPSSSGEGSWLTEATKWVSQELIGLPDNQHLQLTVDFTMLNTVYVREITLMQECPTLRTCVKTMQLRNELILREFGDRDEQSIKRLRQMHKEIKEQEQLRKFDLKDTVQVKSAEMSLDKGKLWEELDKRGKNKEQQQESIPMDIIDIKEILKESKEKSLNEEKLEDESSEAFSDRENDVETLGDKINQVLDAEPKKRASNKADAVDNLDENNEKDELKAEYSLTSTDHFLDVLLKDLQDTDPKLKNGAQQFMQEILANDNPVARKIPKGTKTTTRPQITTDTMSQALYCGSVTRDAVRPKVRWHQTLMQIELIFEQQVPQYELVHQGNVLIYQVLETTPPQRCILNLLGEVRILSEQQHGYQLHVKLAKHNLFLYWPTLLSSLSAQQHCHWLVYDTERGKSPHAEMGRIIWTRHLRGLCPSNLTDDEGNNFSSDDERSFSDTD